MAFAVFLHLVDDLGPITKPAFRYRVRTFLDKHAIHFYGQDVYKKRSRRRRH